MSFDFGALFSGLGSGLSGYAALKEKEKNDEEDRKVEAAKLALQQATLDETKRANLATAATTERTRLDTAAQHRLDALARQGIIPPDSYESSAKAGALPETPGSDVAGMAINALRTAGQADTKQFESGVTSSMNHLYQSGGLSEDIPGGGRVFIQPGVRSNLDVAHTNAETAAENRRMRVQIAKIEADSRRGAHDPAAQAERERVKFMNEGIARRMKPRPDPESGRLTQPGMNQNDAYRETLQEWNMIKGLGKDFSDVEAGNGPASSGGGDGLDDARAVVEGLDPNTARQHLEATGYTPDEIVRILRQ